MGFRAGASVAAVRGLRDVSDHRTQETSDGEATDLLALVPENRTLLFQSVYSALRNPEEAGAATSQIALLKAPVIRSVNRLKQRGMVAEANLLQHEFRHLLHALNRLETHFDGLVEGKEGLMGDDESFIYTAFAEQSYEALLAHVAELDGRRLH